MMCGFPFTHLVSARDRLIQLKFMHMIYYIPAKQAKIYPATSVESLRCSQSPADFSHIFWHCSVVQEFWAAVEKITSVPVLMTLSTCLLGLGGGANKGSANFNKPTINSLLTSP